MVRAVSATVAPSRARRCAIALPSPRLVPVTRATLPSHDSGPCPSSRPRNPRQLVGELRFGRLPQSQQMLGREDVGCRFDVLEQQAGPTWPCAPPSARRQDRGRTTRSGTARTASRVTCPASRAAAMPGPTRRAAPSASSPSPPRCQPAPPCSRCIDRSSKRSAGSAAGTPRSPSTSRRSSPAPSACSPAPRPACNATPPAR